MSLTVFHLQHSSDNIVNPVFIEDKSVSVVLADSLCEDMNWVSIYHVGYLDQYMVGRGLLLWAIFILTNLKR